MFMKTTFLVIFFFFCLNLGFSQTNNQLNPSKTKDPKTLMWEKTRAESIKNDSVANQNPQVADPETDPKTKMWKEIRAAKTDSAAAKIYTHEEIKAIEENKRNSVNRKNENKE
jgi:hypothetical protein